MKNKLIVSSTILAAMASCSTAKEAEIEKPNVIYILADDLGYGDIGPYGQAIIKTPHLDQMAAEGMQFMQHYAGCTVSAPSRGSVMTGMHTGQSQIRGNKEIAPEGQAPLDDGTFTLGKMMQSAGYATGIFGKWGLGFPGSHSVPSKMGFDEFYGYNCQRKAHTYYPEYLWDNDEMVYLEGNKDGATDDYSQQLIHEKGIEFIRNNKDKPFFAMLTYTLPHAELKLPHDSIYKMYENTFEETPHSGSYSPVEQPRATFAAMVSQLDFYVGEIIAELKAQGIDDKTLIIFTSDNGPHMEGGADPHFFKSYGPLKGLKRDVYEGGIRVPMLARYPGKIEAGSKTDHISAFWDVMPTIAELSGAEVKSETSGISFVPTLLANKDQKEHEYLYWEFHEIGGRVAVRKGNWKAVLLNARTEGKNEIELYDLSKDIHEDNNVAEAHPEIVAEMKKIMQEAHVESESFPFYTQK